MRLLKSVVILLKSVVILKHTRRDSLFGTCPAQVWTLWAARLEVKDARKLCTHLTSRGSVYPSCPRSCVLHPACLACDPKHVRNVNAMKAYVVVGGVFFFCFGFRCVTCDMITFCASVLHLPWLHSAAQRVPTRQALTTATYGIYLSFVLIPGTGIPLTWLRFTSKLRL